MDLLSGGNVRSGGTVAARIRKISKGNTLTGNTLTSYIAGNLDRLYLSKISSASVPISKDITSPTAPKTEDEKQTLGEPATLPLDGCSSGGVHHRKYIKQQPSEQHQHATSLLHQIYEKKHQQQLQQQLHLCVPSRK